MTPDPMAPDPLDALRLPATPIEPPLRFAAALRARIASRLETTTMAITPYLILDDADAAIAFYAAAFGAVETFRLDMPDGRVGHAELSIGGAEIALADEYPEWGLLGPIARGGTTVTLQLEVPDVDEVVAAAVAAGATLERPVADQFHGNRVGTVIDPFGHRWSVRTHLEDVPLDEMRRRLDELEAGD
jgi:PhnB protein